MYRRKLPKPHLGLNVQRRHACRNARNKRILANFEECYRVSMELPDALVHDNATQGCSTFHGLTEVGWIPRLDLLLTAGFQYRLVASLLLLCAGPV